MTPLASARSTRRRWTRAATKRFGAFVRQAREYFNAVSSVEPVAKPLVGYYFMLNLVKAFLTAKAPASTSPPRLHHGLSSHELDRQRYWFAHETIQVNGEGIFRAFAGCTGAGFCWPKSTKIPLAKLLPYLVEAFDLLQDSGATAKLLPVKTMDVWVAPEPQGRNTSIRVHIERDVLERHGVPPSTLSAHRGHLRSVLRAGFRRE